MNRMADVRKWIMTMSNMFYAIIPNKKINKPLMAY